jgi:hypothetical protein
VTRVPRGVVRRFTGLGARVASPRGLGGLLGIAGFTAITACGVLPGDAAGGQGGARAGVGRVVAVVRHEVHEQCPLLVTHPSAHAVTTQAQWAQLLASPRVLPPPYDATRTDFSRNTLVLVALPASPQPAWVALAGPDAVRWSDAEQRVDITLRVERRPDAAGTQRAAVMSSVCLLAWLPALPGLSDVVARSASGEVIARSQR